MKVIWILTLPMWLMAVAMLAFVVLSNRKRRWRDRARLGKPSAMPPELLDREPRKVRDMAVGEESWISSYYVAVSKTGRTYVDWTALLCDPPGRYSLACVVQIRRRERGFSMTVKPDDHFSRRLILWGQFAPIIEILQAAPQEQESKQRR